MPLFPGQILENRYRIVRQLGEGGFGAVYRAWDTKLSGPCAVKESFETTPAAQKQFAREASLLFNLRHPNLPRVFDSFVIPNQGMYLVMDFVEGRDLQEMLDQSAVPLPEEQVLPWIGQICDALIYLHSQNPPVIHRDLKPANIRITSQGQAMLVDFGIAKLYDPKLKTTGVARAVTPGYSPHEQYGQGSTDARSDVYALGATLYALLTGAPPVESIQRVARDPLEPVERLNPAVSPRTAAAVGRALRVDPEGRFQSVVELKEALSSSTSPALPMKGKRSVATVATPSQPVAVPSSPLAPTAIVAPAVQRRALSTWVWLGALGGLAVVVFLVSALLGNWLGGGPTPTVAPVGATLHTQTVTLTSTPAEPSPTETPISFPSVTPTQTLTPSPTAPEKLITDGKGLKMALVPSGEFQMGSDSGDSDERPVHTVYLDAYYIDVYEVTNTLYADCVASGACETPGCEYYGNTTYVDRPVVCVTWNQARTYCEWRGGSLPTEAQWEKAARGGLEGMAYPWGDESPNCTQGAKNGAQFANCGGSMVAVGGFARNGYGLYDMAGNVWEWVWDWYQETFYNITLARNPTGPDTGQHRVLRGGGWTNSGRNLRVANRDWGVPSALNYNWGFRCARFASLALPATPITTIPVTPAPLLPTGTPASSASTPAPLPVGEIPMALIPAGEFQMGSENGDSDEKPVHTVYLDDLYIDVYEVTNARYAECVAAGKCDPPTDAKSYTRSSYYGNPAYADYPVIYVTWFIAQAYCEWRGGSLPTEAQWEKAARGGLEWMAYPWGDEAPTCTQGAKNGANFASCSLDDTMAIGSFSPNGYGLYDMAGNVREWVMDWYLETFYNVSPASNPTGPDSGTYRVLRGGSWRDHVSYLRAASRIGFGPTASYDYVGFRCARSR